MRSVYSTSVCGFVEFVIRIVASPTPRSVVCVSTAATFFIAEIYLSIDSPFDFPSIPRVHLNRCTAATSTKTNARQGGPKFSHYFSFQIVQSLNRSRIFSHLGCTIHPPNYQCRCIPQRYSPFAFATTAIASLYNTISSTVNYSVCVCVPGAEARTHARQPHATLVRHLLRYMRCPTSPCRPTRPSFASPYLSRAHHSRRAIPAPYNSPCSTPGFVALVPCTTGTVQYSIRWRQHCAKIGATSSIVPVLLIGADFHSNSVHTCCGAIGCTVHLLLLYSLGLCGRRAAIATCAPREQNANIPQHSTT